MSDLVAAEWLKLHTTRLLLGMVTIAVVISVAAVAGSVLATDRAGIALQSDRGLQRVLPITGTGAVFVLLLGIVIATGEHRHGTASDTFLTTPRRERVVIAKLGVGAAVGLATGVVVSAVCVVTAAVMYSVKDTSFPLGDEVVWSMLAGTLVYSTLFAVIGVGLGTLVRNQVLAVAGALAWVAVVEHILVNLIPEIGKWLPTAAGQAIVRTPLENLLSPLAGAVLLGIYATVITIVGVRVAATRDV